MNAATLRQLLMEQLPTHTVLLRDLIRDDAEMSYEGSYTDD